MPRANSFLLVRHANKVAFLLLSIILPVTALAQGPGWLDDADVERAASQRTVRREPQPIRSGGFVQQLQSFSDGLFRSKDSSTPPRNGGQPTGGPATTAQNPWLRAAQRARQDPSAIQDRQVIQAQRFTDADAEEQDHPDASSRARHGQSQLTPKGNYASESQARTQSWTQQSAVPQKRTRDGESAITNENSPSPPALVRPTGAADRFRTSEKKKAPSDRDSTSFSDLAPPEVRISEFNAKKPSRPNLKLSTTESEPPPTSSAKKTQSPQLESQPEPAREVAPKVARKTPPKRTAEPANVTSKNLTEFVAPPPSQTKSAPLSTTLSSTPAISPTENQRDSTLSNSQKPTAGSSLTFPPSQNLTSPQATMNNSGHLRATNETARPANSNLSPRMPATAANLRTGPANFSSAVPALNSPSAPSSPNTLGNYSANIPNVPDNRSLPNSNLTNGLSVLPHTTKQPTSEGDSSSQPLRSSSATRSSSSSAPHPRGLLNMEIPHITVQMLGPADLQMGTPADYQFIVHNQDRIGVSGLLLSLDIPSAVAVERLPTNHGEVRLEKSDDNSTMLTWILPEIGANTIAKLPLRLTASDARNFAVAMEWTIVPQAGNRQLEVRQAQLRLALEGPSEVEYGIPHVYRLRVSNPGNAPANNVVVNLSSDSNGTSSSEIGEIGPGQEQVVDVELTFQHRGAVSIAASATSGPNLRTQSQIEVRVRQAVLSASLIAPAVAFHGSVTACEARITNTGDADAKNIAASIVVPAGCSLVSTPQGATVEGNTLTWTMPRLAAGETATYPMQFSSTKSGVQTIQFHCATANGVVSRSDANFEVEAIADLKLVVNDPPAPAPVNSEVVYELTVTNRGSRDASNVKIQAHFSDGIEPVRAEGTRNKIVPGQVLFEPINNIQPGQILQMKVYAKALTDGTHRFRAEVRCEENETRLVQELSTRFLDSVRRVASPPPTATYR